MMALPNIPVLSRSDPEVRGVAIASRIKFTGETIMLVIWESGIRWTDIEGLLPAEVWLHAMTVPTVTYAPGDVPK